MALYNHGPCGTFLYCMMLYQVFIYCMISILCYDLLYMYARGGARTPWEGAGRGGRGVKCFLDLICANDVIILRGLLWRHANNNKAKGYQLLPQS